MATLGEGQSGDVKNRASSIRNGRKRIQKRKNETGCFECRALVKFATYNMTCVCLSSFLSQSVILCL